MDKGVWHAGVVCGGPSGQEHNPCSIATTSASMPPSKTARWITGSVGGWPEWHSQPLPKQATRQTNAVNYASHGLGRNLHSNLQGILRNSILAVCCESPSKHSVIGVVQRQVCVCARQCLKPIPPHMACNSSTWALCSSTGDSRLQLCVSAIHCDERWWEHAERFKPKR